MLSVAEVIYHFLGHGEESLDVVVDAICLEVLECDADFVAVIGTQSHHFCHVPVFGRYVSVAVLVEFQGIEALDGFRDLCSPDNSLHSCRLYLRGFRLVYLLRILECEGHSAYIVAMFVNAVVNKLPDFGRLHARLYAHRKVVSVGKDAVEVVQQHVAQNIGFASPCCRLLYGKDAMSRPVVDKHVAVGVRFQFLHFVVVDAVYVFAVACPPFLQLAVVDAPYVYVALLRYDIVGQTREFAFLVLLAKVVHRIFVEQAGKAGLCYIEVVCAVGAVRLCRNGRLRVLVEVVFVNGVRGFFFVHKQFFGG